MHPLVPGGSPLPPVGGGAGEGELGALGGEAIGEPRLLQPLDPRQKKRNRSKSWYMYMLYMYMYLYRIQGG